ncbi:MAG: aldolase/citrate lyase family protein, partial [Propionivibrio sp.]
PLFQCDAVQIDLEDAVPLSEKDAARILVRRYLENYQERNKEILVRINGLDTKWALDDLKAVLPALPDGIRLPKADSPEIVERLDTLLTEYEEDLGLTVGHFRILPSIETAQGVINAARTARASSRLIGLAFGAEDYTTTMEIERTKTGEELFNARMMVLWGAKAAGIQAIDSIFADVNDMESLRRETELVKRLGFTGKALVNPRQIDVIHEVFAPKQGEIDYALEVIDAIKRAREMGTGVISLKGKMIDRPIVMRAARVLNTARAHGMVDVIINEEDIHGAE